jgi:hypothetical protein
MKRREEIIKNYVEAYNHFDTNRMVTDFDDMIRFENISNGETNLTIEGLAAFKDQAEKTNNYFLKRKQTIKSFTHHRYETEVEVSYHAIAATDLPNGIKEGEEFNLEGKSVFTFANDKVIELKDIS